MFGTTATSASHIATAPATAHATTDPAATATTATATGARPQTTPRHPSVASMGASLSTSTTFWALRISESVQWVARVNFAWIVLTLLGGVVFGFAPAAFATAAACRERLRTGHDARLREFVGLWRRDFWRANGLLLPVVVVDGLLATALTLAVQTGSILIALPSGAVVLVAVLATVLLPSLYSHYDIPLVRYVPTATRFVLSNPVSMVLLALSCAAIAFVSALVAALIVFVSIGAWMQFSSALCLSFFHANDRRLDAADPDPGAR